MHGSKRVAIPIGIMCCLAGCDTGSKVTDRPRSVLALRYEATVPQLSDFTCGAASLATVLTFYWKTPTSENKLLGALTARYTDEEIEHINETGMTFDDLILMANAEGFQAEGIKLPAEKLVKVSGPAIVHLDKGDLKHFVVLRKVGDGVYYLSDPIVGQLAMHSDEFNQQYTGDVLAVWKDGEKLPTNTVLASPRDGINLPNTLSRMITVPQTLFSRTSGQ